MPVDSYQSYQQSYQYQPQYNYNQPLMDQGGSQYHNYTPQQQQQHVEYQDYYHQQPQPVFIPPPPQQPEVAETWNISQNKASYVVSISIVEKSLI